MNHARSIATLVARLKPWLCAVVVPLVLAACGGGGNYAAGGIVGTASVPIVAVGAISGFGAPDTVTLAAKQFSLSGATVTVNDQAASAAALKVGMVVTVQADVLADGTSAAHTVSYRADVRGVVDGVDTTAGTFTLLGQRIPVNKLTVFDGGTFGTLVSQYVEVSGYRTSPGELVATRVEIKPSFVAGVTPLDVIGTVVSLDTTSRTFHLGTQVIDYSQLTAAQVPVGLANGATFEAKGTSFTAAGALIANSLEMIAATPPAPSNATVEIEGYVSEFASIASFKVNGQLVNATGALADGGPLDMIANDVKVDVEGHLVNGVLVASKVEFEDVPSIVLDGFVEAIDTSAAKLTVAGQTVSVQPSTQFEDLSAAALRNFALASIAVGDRVTVRAVHSGNGLVAQRIERRDRTAPPPADSTAEVQGAITAFVSVANFDVAGRKVNANSASFSGGSAANLAVGVRVHVQGTLSDSVIIAQAVEILPADPTPPNEVELSGAIASFVSVANFHVNGQTVDATGAQFSNGTAADLANGRFVHVEGTLSAGIVHAHSVEFENVSPPPATIEAEGVISSFVSVASFKIANQPVDATNATFTHGRPSDLANGRIAHAVGPLVNGVLRATSISVEDSSSDQAVEVEGTISNFVSVSQFTVAGRTIDASTAHFSGGNATNLANGRRVQVHGTLVSGVVRASTVEFDD